MFQHRELLLALKTKFICVSVFSLSVFLCKGYNLVCQDRSWLRIFEGREMCVTIKAAMFV